MKTKIYRDPVVEAYMPGVDRTLLRENLKLTPAQRLEKLVSFSSFAATLRRAGQRALRGRARASPARGDRRYDAPPLSRRRDVRASEDTRPGREFVVVCSFERPDERALPTLLVAATARDLGVPRCGVDYLRSGGQREWKCRGDAAGGTMLHWALIFFIVALVAAVLGLRGVAGLSAEIGYMFVVVAVIFLVIAVFTGRGPVTP